MQNILFGLVSLFSLVTSFELQYTLDALNDQITNLPGLNDPINFNQFSGYLNLGTSKKQIHYWFRIKFIIFFFNPLLFFCFKIII